MVFHDGIDRLLNQLRVGLFLPAVPQDAGRKKTEQLEEDIDDSVFDFLPFFTVEQVVLYGAKL